MNKNNLYKKSIPQDIIPQDDAFHGSTKLFANEWWYFDAIFDNKYSIHIGFTTVSKNNIMSFPEIEIYKDGKLEVRTLKRYLFQDFQISKKYPLVKIFDKKIIEFDQERFIKRGEWLYYVTPKVDDIEINLTFIGTTPGWKIEWNRERWTVALPKASVTGEINYHGDKIKVQGVGYHDHNWSSNLSRVLNLWGWFWGKITCKTLNIVLAYVMKSPSKGELIAVVNQGNKGYFKINPKNIQFKSNRFIRNFGRKMPTYFTLQIDDVVNDIHVVADIKIEVKNIHRRNKIMLIAPYWRYHVNASGVVSLDSYKEEVNHTQIMEFFRLI